MKAHTKNLSHGERLVGSFEKLRKRKTFLFCTLQVAYIVRLLSHYEAIRIDLALEGICGCIQQAASIDIHDIL